MSPISLLISSPDSGLADLLRQNLESTRFRVVTVQPGPAFVEMTRRERPQIAVLDCAQQRPDMTQMEIAVLRDTRPDVRIIALSSESTAKDAEIVERGVFYYMTLPAGPELIRVIEAAARPAKPAHEKPAEPRGRPVSDSPTAQRGRVPPAGRGAKKRGESSES